MVAITSGTLKIDVALGDVPCDALSTFSWAGGGRVLTIATVLPEARLAVELTSTYSGHHRTGTIATHLLLGPGRSAARINTERSEPGGLDPVERPRACVYDHAHRLIEALRTHGVEATVEVDELTFVELEAVE